MQYLQCFKVIYGFKKINISKSLIITNRQIKLYEKQRRENIGVETDFAFRFASGFSL